MKYFSHFFLKRHVSYSFLSPLYIRLQFLFHFCDLVIKYEFSFSEVNLCVVNLTKVSNESFKVLYF